MAIGKILIGLVKWVANFACIQKKKAPDTGSRKMAWSRGPHKDGCKEGLLQITFFEYAILSLYLEGEFPPAPPRAPQLVELPVHTHGAWRYRVDPGNTSLAFSSKEQGGLQLTSFLFQVHQTGQRVITYYWLVRNFKTLLISRSSLWCTWHRVWFYLVTGARISHSGLTVQKW